VDPFPGGTSDGEEMHMTSRQALSLTASASNIHLAVPKAAQSLVAMMTQRLHE
jgi:hypothetical protein